MQNKEQIKQAFDYQKNILKKSYQEVVKNLNSSYNPDEVALVLRQINNECTV